MDMEMNRLIIGKKSYTAIAAMVFTAVCIGAILLWRCMSGYDKLTQSRAIIFLNSSVIVPADKVTDAATANPEKSQIAIVPEPAPPLNTAIEDSLPQWLTVRMRVTAYCPCKVCCGRFAKGQTANGYVIKCRDHFAAAPQKYPFGTEIIVPQYNGDKPIIINDRGGAIKGNRLDVFFQSHARATKWGVKYLDVKVRTSRQIN
jgi:3D (Asp-Asp-Asp) domain-containing protein